MRIAAIALIFASGLVAQRNAVSPSGFGRIMFPGGGPTGAYSGAVTSGSYGSVVFPGTAAPAAIRATTTRNNYPAVLPVAPAVQHNRGHNQAAIVPYPVFVGGGYYNYDAPYAQYANYGISQAWPTPGQPGFSGTNYNQPVYVQASQQAEPQQEPSPVVIINQYFRPDAAPVTQTTTSASAAAPITPQPPEVQSTSLSADMQTIFLIAMKDHTIYAANSYWVEDNTLSYITVQGTENSVSMDLIDRDLSRRLNRDRKVAFGLPVN